MKKARTDIPQTTAARVLFLSDRTCCVCRRRGKPVQIHHIDENTSNSDLRNLAVLCLECHRDTQICGGFDRKLDADQVVLYRDDWHALVARSRVTTDLETPNNTPASERLNLAMTLAEIYRENEQYELLAIHYNVLGNAELRDKYIELALARSPGDSATCFLRGLQGKPELIPSDVIERELARYAASSDILQRARFYKKLGRNREATQDYVDGISASLREGSVFSAAYYLKELATSGLIGELLVLAFGEAQARGEIWWQVRALQELGWDSELRDLLLRHAADIEASNDITLQVLLADARGDVDTAMALRKESARHERLGVYEPDDQSSEDEGY